MAEEWRVLWLTGGRRVLARPGRDGGWFVLSEQRDLALNEEIWDNYLLAAWAGRQAEVEEELAWNALEEMTRP